MTHDQLLVQEVIHRAQVLISRAEGLSADESVRALSDRAARAGVSLHIAAMGVLGRSAAWCVHETPRGGLEDATLAELALAELALEELALEEAALGTQLDRSPAAASVASESRGPPRKRRAWSAAVSPGRWSAP